MVCDCWWVECLWVLVLGLFEVVLCVEGCYVVGVSVGDSLVIDVILNVVGGEDICNVGYCGKFI